MTNIYRSAIVAGAKLPLTRVGLSMVVGSDGKLYKILPGGLIVNVSVAVPPEATALFAAMTVQPSAARKTIIATCISSLISSGVWAKLDRLYVLAAHTEQASLLDWVHPGTDSLARFDANPIIFEKDRGFSTFAITSGSYGQLRNTVQLGSIGQYGQNNAHISAWFLKDSPTAYPFGASVGRPITILPNSGSSTATWTINTASGTESSFSISNYNGQPFTKGMFLANRGAVSSHSAGDQYGWLNGVNMGSQTVASTTDYQTLNASIIRGSQCEASMMSLGAALTDAQILAFYQAMQTYMIAMGTAIDTNYSSSLSWTADFAANPTIATSGGPIFESQFTETGMIRDWELLPRYTQRYEVPFWGYRRVENLMTNTDPPLPATAVANQTITTVVGQTYILSFTGTGSIAYTNTTGTASPLAGQGASTRVTTGALTATSTTTVLTITGDVRFAQLENTTGQAIQTIPSEYVSVGSTTYPYQGAAVDGVQYYTTQNGNTVNTGVVTAGVGAACPAILGIGHFKRSSNNVLQSENFGTTWTAISSPSLVAGNVKCGPISLDLLGDATGTLTNGYQQTFLLVDPTPIFESGIEKKIKNISMFVKKGTSTSSTVTLTNTTRSETMISFTITWSGNTPVITITTGDTNMAVAEMVQAYANTCFRINVRGTSASGVAGDTLTLKVFPATSTAGNINVGGVQGDDSPIMTDYKPTTTTIVTQYARALIQQERDTLLSWMNSSAGTMQVKYKLSGQTGAYASLNGQQYPAGFQNSNGGANARILAIDFTNEITPASGQHNAFVCNSGTQRSIQISGVVVDTVYNTVSAFALNDGAFSVNGSAVSTDALCVGVNSGLNYFYTGGAFGPSYGVGGYGCMGGYISKLSYTNSRLSNAAIIALST